MAEPDVSAWSDVGLDHRVEGGHRNEVWSGHDRHGRVAVRQSRRSPASLAWELQLLTDLGDAGFLVPEVVPTVGGAPSHNSIVVQRWIGGQNPTTDDDWKLVAAELQRLHAHFIGYGQRPGCCQITRLDRAATSVDADMAALPDEVADTILAVFMSMSDAPTSLIHGDPGPSNIRITEAGRVGLLDWDESRIDVTHLDLADLGIQVLDDDAHTRARHCADAWEAANAWVAEPDYARHRLDQLPRHDG